MKWLLRGEVRTNIVPRSHWLVGIVVALCLFTLVVSPASAAPPQGAPPQGGFTPANAYPSQPPLTPQQQQWSNQKEAAVAAWVQSDGAHKTKTNGIQPNCVSSPTLGPNTVCNWITVSLGGQYTIEPASQPNWCGPGSATAVAMHWDPNGVAYNHTPYSAREDPNWGGYWTTYYNQQGWMAWFAQGLGVQPYPNTAANTGGMAWGLNTALNTGFYLSTGVGANEAVLFSHVTFDIGSSRHPMIYLVNANKLPEWRNWGGTGAFISHFIEGYGYGYFSDDPSNTSTEVAYYADTASSSDGPGNVAGDYSMTFDDFYTKPWLSGYQYIVW